VPFGNDSLLSESVVNVGVAATLLAAANGGRKSVLVRNDGDNVTGITVFVGSSTVTIANGIALQAGATADPGLGDAVEIEGSAAVYAIVAAGTQDVRVMELSD
jgi:hypothetical protein